MDKREYSEANRAAWNEAIPYHRKGGSIHLKEKFAEPGFSTLDALITEKLKAIPVAGKRVAQLCCNNGRETLSLCNLGAESAVGFDISDEAIKDALEFRDASGLNCEFVRTDIYDVGEEFNDSFDLVFISIGVVSWFKDLPGFFAVASRILKPGGVLVMYEQHPFTFLLATQDEEPYDPSDPMKIAYPYFRTDHWCNETGLDYIGKTTYKSRPSYSFTHRVSDILMSLIDNGLTISEFREYAHDLSEGFTHVESEELVPLSCLVVACKTP